MQVSNARHADTYINMPRLIAPCSVMHNSSIFSDVCRTLHLARLFVLGRRGVTELVSLDGAMQRL